MRNASSLPVYLALAALLLVGTYLRVHGATDYYYNSDEATHVHIAQATSLAEVLSFSRYEVHPPILYILCHYWMMISDDPSFVRGLSLLFGLGTIFLFYQVGRAANGHIAGLVCAVLATFSHVLIILSFSVRQYAPFLFFMTAAFYYFVRLNRKPDLRKLLCYTVCSFAACMSHFSALLTLVCIAVTGTLILLRKRARFSTHASWAAAHLVVMGITLKIYLAWAPILDSMKPFFDAATFRALSPLGARLMAALTFPFVVGDYLFPAGTGAAAIALLLIAGLVFLSPRMRGGSDLHRFVLLAFIGFALGMTLLFTGYYPHLGARHSSWLLPLLLPVAAWTFTSFTTWIAQCAHDKSPARFLPPAAATCLALAAFFLYDADTRFNDTREYVLTMKEWHALSDTLDALTPKEVILTERDDGTLFTNLYGTLGDIPFNHSTELMSAPYNHTRILFNPYYARSYTKAALFTTLQQAEDHGNLQEVETIVFYHTPWSRSPIIDLLNCTDAVTKVITYPKGESSITADEIGKRPAALLFIPKDTVLKAGDDYAKTGKVCP